MQKNFDVIIFGGGLAGLTLSLQLKQTNSSLSVLVLERRKETAPESTHKVGESTVELGTYYLRETLNLKSYLDSFQLPKHGLRFFFSPENKKDISKRVELGPRVFLPVPSHQIDRGPFENELIKKTSSLGVVVVLGAKVFDVSINDPHAVSFTKKNLKNTVFSRWVIDATGRASFLKRKLKLSKTVDHQANASWFRVKGEIDVDNWSKNKPWASLLKPGLRRLSTIHLMGEGYWVWLIPLFSGNTSVGIVADPKYHDFGLFNSFERAMVWLKKNEPNLHSHIKEKKNTLLDFKVMKHYSHSCEKLYSTDRWAITGESGVFLDPFYSPGTDFIALNNTFICDLVSRDKRGEDLHLRTAVFERTHLTLFDNWVPIYKDMYGLWGKTQTMVLKIFWDWATYWSVPTLLFTNKGYTNLGVLRKLFSTEGSVGQKFGLLNRQMQNLFIEWGPFDTEVFSGRYIDPFDIDYLKSFHKEIEEQFEPQELVKKIEENVSLLEEVASEIFRLISRRVNGTPLDLLVDPYTMSLSKKTTQKNGVLARKEIKKDVKTMWFY